MYEQYSQNGRCLTLERFLLKDYVHRFLLWYTLALFAAWTIRRTGGDSNNLGLRRLNRVLVVVTVLNVFGLAYLQHFGPATFTSSYISLVVFNSLLAIAISVYVCQPMSILTSKKPAKLSLPGTALFGGLVSRKYYVMVVLCCVVLYAFLLVVPSLLACMHACIVSYFAMHHIYHSLSTAWLWWLQYRHFGAKMVYS
jgi:hypothetical protein